MYEEDLKRIICLHPELIEEGLKINSEEYPIYSSNSIYRCDILAEDKNNRPVFIELKLKATGRVVFQIAKYKSNIDKNGRFIVAAFDFGQDVIKVLKEFGFESCKIDYSKVYDLLKVEKNNPKLYQRKTN